MAHEYAFVQSIATPGTVRLDLSDEPTWRVLADGTSVDPPPLESTELTTSMTDGSSIPWSAYRNRTIVLHLQLKAAGADALAAEEQLLSREVDRERNTLKWQPSGATHPVYFRTKRADITSIDEVVPGKHNRYVVEIEADPFAYGAQETLSPATVNNDPAAGSNGMFFDVTGVKGDVETPLHLAITAAGVVAAGRRKSIIAVRRRGTPSNMPGVIQAETMTLGANTTLPGNDAVMSGAGSNYARLSSLTTTAAVRLTSALHPASASVDNRGTYRWIARLRQSVGADAYRLTLEWSGDGTNWISQDTVLAPGGTALRLVDLGALVQLPVGEDLSSDGAAGDELAVRGAQFRLAASRDSGGSGNLEVDYLLPIPADDAYLTVLWPGTSGPTTMVVGWDHDRLKPVVSGRGSSGEIYSPQIPEAAGGMPFVSPGVTNRITFVLDAGSTSSGDTKGNTVSVTPYYWPRYLRVRPAST